MDKQKSLFQSYLAMKSNLFILNSLHFFSFFKEVTINTSPTIPKDRVGSIILEFTGDRNKKAERFGSKSQEEWTSN